MKKNPLCAFSLMVCLGWAFVAFPSIGKAGENRLNVLNTTFPVHQITRNVAKGRDTVKVDLLIPPQVGCPHDYALTPQDMQKISSADILVINGLGMEAFAGALVEKANSRLVVIDSSKGVKNLLHYRQSEKKAPNRDVSGNEDRHRVEGEHEHGPDNGPGAFPASHGGENPHLFASPRMAAILAQTIAAGLSSIDPAGEVLYTANAAAYAERMNRLADAFADLGKRLKNNRIVTQHGVFDYLARDMGLDVVAVVQAHDGQEPSAAQMLDVVKTIKAENAGAIFTEPQYPEKIGAAIAREAAIVRATLDPVATGPQNAPLDHYEIIMRENLKTLEQTLGTR